MALSSHIRVFVVRHSQNEKDLSLLDNLEKLLHHVLRMLFVLVPFNFLQRLLSGKLFAVKLWLKQKLCNIWQWMKTDKKVSDCNSNIWCRDSWWGEWWNSKGNNLGLTNIVFLILFIHPSFIQIFTHLTSFKTQRSSEIFPSFENQTSSKTTFTN